MRVRTFVALVGLGIVAQLSSCQLFTGGTTRFLIRIDSVTAPAAVAVTDTLVVRINGFIGRDGCSGLSHIERTRAADRLDLVFHGVRRERSGISCAASPSFLNHTEVIPPPFSGSFVVSVRQPDGSELERTVAVQ